MSTLQSDISPLLMSLKPLPPISDMIDDFPFLALNIENEWNSIHMGTTSLSGDFCIEESEVSSTSSDILTKGEESNVSGGRIRRRLVFLRNQSLIQTEVQLEVPSKKSNKKKKKSNKSANSDSSTTILSTVDMAENDKNKCGIKSSNEMSKYVFDYSFIDAHHRAFLSSFLLSSYLIKQIHNQVRILLIGLGGGALTMFLQKYIPRHLLTTVDLEPDILGSITRAL